METERVDCEEIFNDAGEQIYSIGDAHEQIVDIERIDWSMCFLCQNTNKNMIETLRHTETGIKKISEQLHKFAEIIEHKYELRWIKASLASEFLNDILINKHALYHKSWHDDYNDTKLTRTKASQHITPEFFIKNEEETRF